MADIQAEDPIEIAAGDSYSQARGDAIALDFTNVLGSATIASVDSVTVNKDGLTLSNEAANTSTYTETRTVDGVETEVTVGIGKAVLLDKASGSTPRLYTVRVIVTASTGSEREGVFLFDVG